MDTEQLDLENFLLNNPDLERLEALLSEFNIFETLGAVRVELRHSEFLAFLMNPNQNDVVEEWGPLLCYLGELFPKVNSSTARRSEPSHLR